MFNSDLYVLTRKEKRMLAKVDTTVDEAWIILKRNYKLLEALYYDMDYVGYIGCPHCRTDYLCAGVFFSPCRWKAINEDLPEPMKGYWCCKQTFGGVKLSETDIVEYSYSQEYIHFEWLDCITDEDFLLAERFLIGHIEWAMRVIRNG